jgi:hypothetical protein
LPNGHPMMNLRGNRPANDIRIWKSQQRIPFFFF